MTPGRTLLAWFTTASLMLASVGAAAQEPPEPPAVGERSADADAKPEAPTAKKNSAGEAAETRPARSRIRVRSSVEVLDAHQEGQSVPDLVSRLRKEGRLRMYRSAHERRADRKARRARVQRKARRAQRREERGVQRDEKLRQGMSPEQKERVDDRRKDRAQRKIERRRKAREERRRREPPKGPPPR